MCGQYKIWSAYRELAKIWEYIKDRSCSCRYFEAPESHEDKLYFEQKSDENRFTDQHESATLSLAHIEDDKSSETTYLDAKGPKEHKNTRPQDSHLPPEMLDRLFQLLSPQELKSVVIRIRICLGFWELSF